MKSLSLILTIFILSISIYFISCDIIEQDKNNNLNTNTNIQFDNFDCDTDPVKCTIPSYCNNGKSMHFCLTLNYGDLGDEFDYESISHVNVTHVGKDCSGANYSCYYQTAGSNPTGMGCVLPWCNNNCKYTRSVCIRTVNNEIYIGSRYFQYENYEDCYIDIYRVYNIDCPSYEQEKSNN